MNKSKGENVPSLKQIPEGMYTSRETEVLFKLIKLALVEDFFFFALESSTYRQ